MFKGLFGKHRASKGVGTSNENEKNTVTRSSGELRHVQGVLHHCYSLSPEAFAELMGSTKLPFFTWYTAFWVIQHQQNPRDTNVVMLAKKIGVSWPTASRVKDRILQFLTDQKALD